MAMEIWIPANKCWNKTVYEVDRDAFLGLVALIVTLYFAHILLVGLLIWVYETIGEFEYLSECLVYLSVVLV